MVSMNHLSTQIKSSRDRWCTYFVCVWICDDNREHSMQMLNTAKAEIVMVI